MALDATQQQRFQAWLRTHQVQLTCPACGTANQWAGSAVVTAPRMEADGTHLDDRVVPMIQVTCQHCAYILLFSGLPMGLHPRKKNA